MSRVRWNVIARVTRVRMIDWQVLADRTVIGLLAACRNCSFLRINMMAVSAAMRRASISLLNTQFMYAIASWAVRRGARWGGRYTAVRPDFLGPGGCGNVAAPALKNYAIRSG